MQNLLCTQLHKYVMLDYIVRMEKLDNVLHTP